MKIKIYDSNLNELGTLGSVFSAKRTERLNGANTLDFSCWPKSPGAEYLNENSVCSLDGDFFDVALFRSSQLQQGELKLELQCEHVSYRLNDPQYNLEYFTMTGTPAQILGAILQGTGFTAGSIDFTIAMTFSLQEAVSRRGLLMQLAEWLGGDLVFYGFTVSILHHRGSLTPKELTVGRNVSVVSKTVNKRNRDDQGNPIFSYMCEVYKVANLALGDIVTIDYEILDIDLTLRILEIVYDPYNTAWVSLEIGNVSDRLEDDIYRIETETVVKNKSYYGTKIGSDNGFETIRSDKKARSVMNADILAWQTGDGDDNWTDQLYYDAVTNKLKFSGDIDMTGGSISWGYISGAPSIPSEYTDQDVINKIKSTYIDDDEVWTVNVYAENIMGTYITGKTVRTAVTGKRIELSANSLITYNASGDKEGLAWGSGVGSSYGDTALYAGDEKALEFYNTLTDGYQIRPTGNFNLYIGAGGKNTIAYGNWNFTNAIVTGLSARAVFG